MVGVVVRWRGGRRRAWWVAGVVGAATVVGAAVIGAAASTVGSPPEPEHADSASAPAISAAIAAWRRAAQRAREVRVGPTIGPFCQPIGPCGGRSARSRRVGGERGCGPLAVGDAGRDADAAVAGAGERDARRGAAARSRRHGTWWCGRYCGNAPGQRVIEVTVGCTSTPRWRPTSSTGSAARRRRRGASTGRPSRPSETRSSCEPSAGRQCAHFCEPNEAAVTVRCSVFGTR